MSGGVGIGEGLGAGLAFARVGALMEDVVGVDVAGIEGSVDGKGSGGGGSQGGQKKKGGKSHHVEELDGHAVYAERA
jgi:hypothetical protein